MNIPSLNIHRHVLASGSQQTRITRSHLRPFFTKAPFVWIAAFGFFLLLCSGCGAQKVTLTQQQDNQSVHVQAGETITLQLDENPSTGFTWEITQMDPNLLTLQDSTYTQNSSGPGETGVGGTHTWTFVAKQSGTVHLQLKLWRKSQGTSSPTQWYNVTLDVQK